MVLLNLIWHMIEVFNKNYSLGWEEISVQAMRALKINLIQKII